MPKQLNVNLQMTADTSQAKKQLQDLQNQLNNLSKSSSSSNNGLAFTSEIQKAAVEAGKLKDNLKNATDVNTGKLDLTKFTQQMKQSGTSLEQYRKSLSALGPEGNKAFAQLALSISNADAKIGNANSKLKQFGTTLANAARWQISSSILHGFMGSVQTAIGYVQDLNESLSNIRIVTGQSVDQMAEFAEKANKAAQALSTTTTAYTDAALIFYQQGLGDKAVEERTNAVIKMAQVTGDSASEVSSYMTAIWNNFDDGSKSLEYYEDVIAKLGATTASSSAEISEGISKFASVAQTAGLSYEYATSALATVVAATRQSADTVGTAFKTLFARIQDLELGKTLDDGTTLGKYSEALATIGVSIKDASGAMRSMDDILDDMGEKWKTLGQDTQTAVAQAVAGTRQYTQLVALMENWDQMKTNVSTAQNSEGAVQEQAEIYAESWEAARKRVRAAAEEIYSSLIDENFFIKMDDMFAKMLNSVSALIKGMGGIPGILTIALAMWTTFSNQLGTGIDNLITKIHYASKAGKQEVENQRTQVLQEAQQNLANNDGSASKILQEYLKNQQSIIANSKNISEEKLKELNILGDIIKQDAIEIDNIEEKNNKLKTQADLLQKTYDKKQQVQNDNIESGINNLNTTKINKQQQLNSFLKHNNNYFNTNLDLISKRYQINDALATYDNSNNDVTKLNNKETQTIQNTVKLFDPNMETKSLQEIIDYLQQLRKDANEIYSMSSKEAQEEIDKYEKEIQAIDKKIKKLEEAKKIIGSQTAGDIQKTYVTREISGSVASNTREQTQNNLTEQNYLQSNKDLAQYLQTLQNTEGITEKLKNQLQVYISKLNNGNISLDGTKELYAKINEKMSDVAGTQDETIDKLADQANANTSYGRSLGQVLDNAKALAEGRVQEAEKTYKAQQAINQHAETLKKEETTYITLGTRITGLVSGLSSLAMSIKQIQSLGNVWSDDSVSTFDKILTTVTTLGMMIPTLAASYGKLTAALVTNNAVTVAEKGSTIALLLARKKLNDSTLNTLSIEKLKAIAQRLDITLTGEETAANYAAIIAEQLHSISLGNLAKAAMKAFAKMLASIAPVLIAIAAIAAGILAINAVMDLMASNDSLAQAENKYASLSSAAETAKDRASELNEELEKIGSAISSYDSAIDALERCTQGTEEWRDALKEVQDQTTKLLDEYPELISMENGLNDDGTVNIEALKEIQDKKEKEANTAQAVSITAQAEAEQAKAELARERVSKENNRWSSETSRKVGTGVGIAAGAATGVAVGAAVGSVVPVAGNIVGAIVGGLAGIVTGVVTSAVSEGTAEGIAHAGTLSDEKVSNVIDEVSKMQQNNEIVDQKTIATMLGMKDGDNYEDYKEIVDHVMSAADSLTEAATAQKNAAKLVISNWKNNNNVTTSDSRVDSIVENRYVKLHEQKIKKLKEENQSDIKDQLLELYDLKDEVKASDLKKDKNGNYTYEDENGEKQTLTLSALATSLLQEDISNLINQVEKSISDLKSGEYASSADAYIDVAAGKTLNTTGWSAVSNMDINTAASDSTIQELFPGLSEDEIKEKLEKASNAAAEEFNAIFDDASAAGETVYDALFFINESDVDDLLSNDNLKKMLSGLKTAFATGGKEAVNSLTEVFKNVKPEDVDSLNKILSEVDWTSPTALKDIETLLKAQGIELDTSSDSWKSYCQSMMAASDGAATAAARFASLRESLAGVQKILKDMSFGSVISDDDYAKLIAVDEGLKDLFVTTADGYKFIGSESDKKSILDTTLGSTDEIKEKYAAANEAGEYFNSFTTDFAKGTNEFGGKVSEGDKKAVVAQFSQDPTNEAANKQVLLQAGISQDAVDEALAIWRDGSKELTDEQNAVLTAYWNGIGELQTAYKNGIYSSQAAEELIVTSTAQTVQDLNQLLQDGTISQETYDRTVNLVAQSAMEAATSVEELQKQQNLASQGGSEISMELYSTNLLRFAESYENCTDEINAYQNALAGGNEKAIAAAQSALENEIRVNELAKTYSLSVDDIKDQARAFQSSEAGLKNNLKAAQQMAVLNQSMNKGVSTLASNWEKWSETLKTADKTSMDYIDAVQGCKSAMKDLLGVLDEDFIPEDFMDSPEVMDLIAKAAEGDVAAINELGMSLAQASVSALDFNENMRKTWEDEDGTEHTEIFSVAEFETNKQTVLNGIAEMQQQLANGALSVGDTVDTLGGDWVNALNEMARATGMSVEEMNSLLNELGVEASVDVVEQKLKTKVPKYRTYTTEPQDGPNGTTYTDSYTETVGFEEVEGVVQVAQINAGDKVGTAPSVTYTGRSAPSDSAKAGGSSKSSSSKNKKGVKNDASQKKNNSEIDRYHEITKVIEDMDRTLSDLNKTKSRAFGKDKIAAICQETAVLKEQSKAYQEKLREAKEYLKQDKAKVQGYGAEIDENGIITNYTSLMEGFNKQYNAAYDQYINAQNAAVAAYNASGKTDTDSEAYDKAKEAADEAWKAAQDAYKDKTDAIKTYEDTVKTIAETEAKIKEELLQIYDNEFEEITISVELNISIEDRKIKLIKELLEDIGDEADRATDRMALYAEQTKSELVKAEYNAKGMEDILMHNMSKKDGLTAEQIKAAGYQDVPTLSQEAREGIISRAKSGSLTEDDKTIIGKLGLTNDEISKLETYSDNLLTANTNLRALQESMYGEASKAFSSFTEEMDKQASHLQSLSKQVSTYKNIVDTVGKDKLDPTGQLTKQLNAQQTSLAKQSATAAKKKVDAIDTSIAQQEAEIARRTKELQQNAIRDGKDPDEVLKSDKYLSTLKKDLDTMQTERDKAQEDWLSSWQEAFEAIGQEFDSNLTDIVNNFGKAVAGAAGSLADLQEQYDMKQNLSSNYLADYEKIYNLSKLTRDINKSISDSKDVKNNQRLAELQEKITASLQSGEKISSYTAENYRRQYELLLAQAQLEDARNNKTLLKLKRDSQGNYSYQYGTDDDNLADAQQNYEDKLYAIQKANDEYQQEMQENIMNLDSWYANYVASLDKTDIHYEEKLQAAQKYYQEQMAFYNGEFTTVLDNNKSLYENEWKTYSDMTGYKRSNDADYVDSFNETVLSQTTGFETLGDLVNTHKEAVNDMTTAAISNYRDYQNNVSDVCNIGGTSVNSFATDVGKALEEIDKDAQNTSQNIANMAENFSYAYANILSNAGAFATEYGPKVQETINNNRDWYNSITEVMNAYADLANTSVPNLSTQYTVTYETVHIDTYKSVGAPDTSGSGGGDTTTSPVTPSTEDHGYETVMTVVGKDKYKDKTAAQLIAEKFQGGQMGGLDASQFSPYMSGEDTKTVKFQRKGFKSASEGITWIKPLYIYASHFADTNIHTSAYDTGGYTGNWNSSDGKLAMLHQKELVLNANDTENMLSIIDSVRKITEAIQSEAANSLSQFVADGFINSLSSMTNNSEYSNMAQNIVINADFPAVSSSYEIQQAFDSLIGKATQRAGTSKNYR